MAAGHPEPPAVQGADRSPDRPGAHHHHGHGFLPVPPHHGAAQGRQAMRRTPDSDAAPRARAAARARGAETAGGPEFVSTAGPTFMDTARAFHRGARRKLPEEPGTAAGPPGGCAYPRRYGSLP